MAEYSDIGHSRALPWQRRPNASGLLTAAAGEPGGCCGDSPQRVDIDLLVVHSVSAAP